MKPIIFGAKYGLNGNYVFKNIDSYSKALDLLCVLSGKPTFEDMMLEVLMGGNNDS